MASNDYGVLFPTSVVGSVPRPDFVRDLISDEKISPAEYEQRMEAAVRYVVAMQENAGLDILTDGEWWRKSYIGVIAELAHGFEVGTNPADGHATQSTLDMLPSAARHTCNAGKYRVEKASFGAFRRIANS